MPFSWVPKLVVPRDMLDMRVPKGAKKIIYRHSEHEVFALFGETSKFDGCIERLSIFQDEAHQIKCEVWRSSASIFGNELRFISCVLEMHQCMP
jgi:hypothetical protein